MADKLKKDELSEKASLIASQSRHEYDLFFSFSSANIEAAKTVVARLRGHGLRVFFSDETLKHRVGESFDKMINHALENSSHFVWFCTPESAASSWVEL
ncbi:MAG: toll/interleukin-1 receptor domain-containing protein [Lewinellaceae bacterium]|nr:toll/interleukin-1 receptor domain-containing protein [Lewinellaceae bacterium]